MPGYLGHGYEHSAWLVLLPNVGQAGEDEHPHDHHQHQQPQLLVADTRHNVRDLDIWRMQKLHFL